MMPWKGGFRFGEKSDLSLEMNGFMRSSVDKLIVMNGFPRVGAAGFGSVRGAGQAA